MLPEKAAVLCMDTTVCRQPDAVRAHRSGCSPLPGAAGQCSCYLAITQLCEKPIGGWRLTLALLHHLQGLLLITSPYALQVLPPEIAARCEGAIGGWCGRYMLQEEIPAKVSLSSVAPFTWLHMLRQQTPRCENPHRLLFTWQSAVEGCLRRSQLDNCS